MGAGGVRVEFDGAPERGLGRVQIAPGGGGLTEGRVGHGAVGFDLERALGHPGGFLELSLPGHARPDRHEGARRRVRIQFDDLLPRLDDLEVVLHHPEGGGQCGPRFEDLVGVLDVLDRPAVHILVLTRGIGLQGLLEGARDVLPLLEVNVDAAEPQADVPAVRVVLEDPEEEAAGLAVGGLGRFRVLVPQRPLGVLDVVVGNVNGAGNLAAVQRRLVLGEGVGGAEQGDQPRRRDRNEPAPPARGKAHHRMEGRVVHESLRCCGP